MQAIYYSDSFLVMQLQAEAAAQDALGQQASAEVESNTARPIGAHPVLPRRGFEIVDRRSNREVYLDGAWAEVFARQIEAWKQQSPTQQEVEETLEGYAALAHTPLVVH